jgi:hypothetical protein
MTHDALLVKLMVMDADESEQTRLSKTTQALRAVVELHKPRETTPPWAYEKYLACSACEEYTNDGAYYSAYPCPTIQVIEKEFGIDAV